MARIEKLRIQGLRSFGPEDQHCQSLTFTSPITCIVGQNGCGKTVWYIFLEPSITLNLTATVISPVILYQINCIVDLQTIIESLRYATTGNCPPGTAAGKSYVYDPKLTMSGEVKGQVKLQFRNIKGQVMLVTRTLQVNQKLNKLESKSIEPTLQLLEDNGEVCLFTVCMHGMHI